MIDFRPRRIYPALKKHLTKKQITLITGMRRTGKTTLLKQLFTDVPSENKLYLDLERLDHRELFSEKNYDAILKAFQGMGLKTERKIYLFLDEIQLAPEIGSILKYLYDAYGVKFIVTGSSSYYLKNLFTESLAGRKKIFELFPLDFGEFLEFLGITSDKNGGLQRTFSAHRYEQLKTFYDLYVRYGGFPEVALAKTQTEKKDIIADIVSSYINIDIKTLSHFRTQKNLENLIKLLASRAGSKLDYAKLSRIAGLSRPTVQSYVDFFEKTYLISRLSVHTKNREREIVKAEKLYFTDNGILNFLSEVGSGVQFENAIFTQLRKFGGLRYYALKTGIEIDFVLNNNIALEAKETPSEGDKKTLSKLAASLGIKKFQLIGRSPSANFRDFLWGGDIR